MYITQTIDRAADLVRKKCNELAPDNIKWACKLIP